MNAQLKHRTPRFGTYPRRSAAQQKGPTIFCWNGARPHRRRNRPLDSEREALAEGLPVSKNPPGPSNCCCQLPHGKRNAKPIGLCWTARPMRRQRSSRSRKPQPRRRDSCEDGNGKLPRASNRSAKRRRPSPGAIFDTWYAELQHVIRASEHGLFIGFVTRRATKCMPIRTATDYRDC